MTLNARTQPDKLTSSFFSSLGASYNKTVRREDNTKNVKHTVAGASVAASAGAGVASTAGVSTGLVSSTGTAGAAAVSDIIEDLGGRELEGEGQTMRLKRAEKDDGARWGATVDEKRK